MRELMELYRLRKAEIKSRLEEFKKVCDGGDWAVFEELCFCVLTANTSAKMGMKAIDALKDVLPHGTLEDLKRSLKECGYRYPSKRAEYIFENRERFMKDPDFSLREKIKSFENRDKLRDYLVENVKGFGYKEASHFLRNIGYRGYAILDKHILKSLCEFGVISCKDRRPPKICRKKEYIEIEEKMKAFAREIGIDFDELDLLLWSRKTGEILK